MDKITIDIAGMTCRSCELLTEGELAKVPGVQKVKTHFRSGTAEVFYEKEKPNVVLLEKAIRDAGYFLGKERRLWISSDIGAWVEFLFALGIVVMLFLFAQALGLFTLSFGATERLESLPFILLLGVVAGFSTCMAIVGGLVLAVAARYSERHPEASARQKFLPDVYFNLGRVGGFAILGGLLGLFGSTLQLSSFSVGILIAAVSVVMLLIGFQLLELFPRLSAWKVMLPKSIARVLGIQSHTQKAYSHTRVMILGALTFFLPCGFTQAVQLYVVTAGSPLIGALSMGVFALGTAPGLLGIGGVAAAARGSFRRFFFKAAGIIVIALGVFNFQNGLTLVSLGTTMKNDVLDGESIGDWQVIRITQRADGYFPNALTVQKDRPVRLIIDSENSYTCASSFVMPKAGIKKTLSPGENVFEFVPEQSGPIPFSCSMGMYRGTITVVE